MVAAIGVVGHRNAGKTTLIERLLHELTARGRRVATIKHDAHDFDIDLPGKDTWRHREAGSRTTIIASSSKVAMVRLIDREASLDDLLGLVDGAYDIVLVEGLRRSPLPKIVAHRPELGLETPHILGEVWAVVSEGATQVAPSAPRLRPDEIGALADLIERRLLQGPLREPAWNLPALLSEAGRLHGHLCPGQALGVRMSILGCDRLEIADPRSSKRLVVFVETDRCGADAVQSVTGCTLGKRTLRFVDHGKLAATFVDIDSGRAVRIAARPSARQASLRFAGGADQRQAQIEAYKALPYDELFTVQDVRVPMAEPDLPGRPHRSVPCAECGEEVQSGRAVSAGGRTLCRGCAGASYYHCAPEREASQTQSQSHRG